MINEEIVNHKDFEKSDKEIESFGSIEEIKYPQEYVSDEPVDIILDDLYEKEMNNSRVQAMFKWFRHNSISTFILSQEYYELPKRTIWAEEFIYHVFKQNSFKTYQNFYQDKASMEMTLDERELLTSIC